MNMQALGMNYAGCGHGANNVLTVRPISVHAWVCMALNACHMVCSYG